MHLNQISGSEFIISKDKKSIIGFLNGKADSMGGMGKARQFKNHNKKENLK